MSTPPQPDEDQAKYDAWVSELQSRRDALGRSARRINWLFPIAAASGAAALAISAWVALFVVGFWLVIAVTARYLILIYRWDYGLQIERTRSDAREFVKWRAIPVEQRPAHEADDDVRARFAGRRIPRQAIMRMPWQR